ncbi:polysaccharide deacetylase family protein [Piscirickettsia litoralis]|uniref:Chitin deacetylase n=1 Tax=Piscirickettsia litoralis TaxID=1891921 RepID=A0ABX3A597_9GAMM|nr:polysaccharide deacetylase family protein [Piscirickettsia litoralis]ODN44027.1 chitin deacetylase [Piscirickettsia litoralis]
MTTRDLVGYGSKPIQPKWPDQAQIAINFVVNYEEGAESNVIHGDAQSESYLTDLPGITPLSNQRHLSSESMFEYGSRCGIWRLLKLFDDKNIPITFFATGLALELNPLLCDYLKNSSHEIAGHGYRWISYQNFTKAEEKIHFQKTLTIIKEKTNKAVSGWYTGRRSPFTRELIIEHGLKYDSESYSDDLPYWLKNKGNNTSHLIIPYTLDCNDGRYAMQPGWNSGEDFLNHLKNTFDCLYQEGKTSPKMMSVGLHPRLSGRPGRSEIIKKFIDYILRHKNIWLCTREEIAHHWYNNHPSN